MPIEEEEQQQQEEQEQEQEQEQEEEEYSFFVLYLPEDGHMFGRYMKVTVYVNQFEYTYVHFVGTAATIYDTFLVTLTITISFFFFPFFLAFLALFLLLTTVPLTVPIIVDRTVHKKHIKFNGPQRILKTGGEIAQYQNSIPNEPFQTASVGQFVTF